MLLRSNVDHGVLRLRLQHLVASGPAAVAELLSRLRMLLLRRRRPLGRRLPKCVPRASDVLRPRPLRSRIQRHRALPLRRRIRRARLLRPVSHLQLRALRWARPRHVRHESARHRRRHLQLQLRFWRPRVPDRVSAIRRTPMQPKRSVQPNVWSLRMQRRLDRQGVQHSLRLQLGQRKMRFGSLRPENRKLRRDLLRVHLQRKFHWIVLQLQERNSRNAV